MFVFHPQVFHFSASCTERLSVKLNIAYFIITVLVSSSNNSGKISY